MNFKCVLIFYHVFTLANRGKALNTESNIISSFLMENTKIVPSKELAYFRRPRVKLDLRAYMACNYSFFFFLGI